MALSKSADVSNAVQKLLFKIAGDGSIRSVLTADNVRLMSIHDFVSKACKKRDDGSYARKTYANLSKQDSAEVKELLLHVFMHKLPGSSGPKTPCTDIRGIFRLLKLLGNKIDRAYRFEVDQLLERYLDGDETLCEEVKANRQAGPVIARAQFVERVQERAESLAMEDAAKEPVTGYVYATVSAAFTGLVKIGRTLDVYERISSLNTGCAPAPHVVVALAPTFDPVRDERLAHAFFADRRREGEFFEVPVAEVAAFFMHHITSPYTRACV